MKHWNRYTTGLALICAVTGLSFNALAAAPAKQMDMRIQHGSFDREAAKAERKEYHQWLVSERVAAARGTPLIVEASADELEAIDLAPKQVPEIVGFSQEVGVDVSFRNVSFSKIRRSAQRLDIGAIEATADGGYVFTAELSSPGATGLRVQFAGFNLPAGAGLYLYTEQGQVFGPYTGRGPLGNGVFDSNTLAGDAITLQLRQVGQASERKLRETHFQITGLGHIRPRLMAGQCSYNASCVESASCTTTDNAVNDAETAVAHMLFRSGGGYYICSGGLIADNDDSNNLPLFLTANHCISKGREASSLENFFDFRGNGCNNETLCQESYAYLKSTFSRTLGASIVSTGRNADYTLLRLAEIPAAPPSGSRAYLGWDSKPVAFEDGTALFRISHPQGAPQSYSEHVVDADAQTCLSWPRGDRIYSKDVLGATEGGSSGSPVVNSSGRVVGQLSGACGTNLGNECDNQNNSTVDGAFASYFSAVEAFLDPDGGGSSCEATENPETSCFDGLDNDCDGNTDLDDADCGSGGLPSGEACTSNGDCASLNCKGKPGSRTCK
jgi:hypothetical protein